MTDQRIGFCCKIVPESPFTDRKAERAWVEAHNIRGTTVTALDRMDRSAAIAKIITIIDHNVNALKTQMRFVGAKPQALRMLRIGSDVLPARTHAHWASAYSDSAVVRALQGFSGVGELAREYDIRLSMHPGQFCCVVSDKPDVVKRSIEELEYHADVARMLGYTTRRLDFKINVHLSGRLGAEAFDTAWSQMSQGLKNCLTIENDEYQAGLDDILVLKDKVGIVLDLHHHFIHTGEYITPDDPRIQRIVESWSGVRPIFHYSQSRSEYLTEYADTKPEFDIITKKHPRGKLRAHSDFYDHAELNKWALGHLVWGDMMAESKMKNLSANQLFTQLTAPT